jgi:hypothetical protein
MLEPRLRQFVQDMYPGADADAGVAACLASLLQVPLGQGPE